MPSLTNEDLNKYRQKRKESYLRGDLRNYIKYSAIIMPEELNVSVTQAADFFKYSPSSLYRLRSTPPKKEESPCGGRRNNLLSVNDETSLINIFKSEASYGRAPTPKEIKAIIENKIGKTIHITSIYRLLSRHGLKKITRKRNLLS